METAIIIKALMSFIFCCILSVGLIITIFAILRTSNLNKDKSTSDSDTGTDAGLESSLPETNTDNHSGGDDYYGYF